MHQHGGEKEISSWNLPFFLLRPSPERWVLLLELGAGKQVKEMHLFFVWTLDFAASLKIHIWYVDCLLLRLRGWGKNSVLVKSTASALCFWIGCISSWWGLILDQLLPLIKTSETDSVFSLCSYIALSNFLPFLVLWTHFRGILGLMWVGHRGISQGQHSHLTQGRSDLLPQNGAPKAWFGHSMPEQVLCSSEIMNVGRGPQSKRDPDLVLET